MIVYKVDATAIPYKSAYDLYKELESNSFFTKQPNPNIPIYHVYWDGKQNIYEAIQFPCLVTIQQILP